MRVRPFAITLLAAALLAPLPAQKLDVDLQRATEKETATGDLKAAIEDYKRIVSRAGSNRPLAAQALLHMADCYRKMGDAESRKIYQRLVQEYADQKDAAAKARERLGGSPGVPATKLVAKGRKIIPDAAVSADGRYLAHTDTSTGDLMLYEISSQTERRITGVQQTGIPNLDDQWPSFSHDGKQVAYEWSDDNAGASELRVSSLAGPPNFRHLYGGAGFEEVRPLDWSPDGQSIAVWVDKPKASEGQLGVVSVRDGSWKPWIALPQYALDRAWFSPDGKYLAYDLRISQNQPKGGLFVLAVGGTSQTEALTQPDECHLMGWSPDGNRLLFTGDLNGPASLWAQSMAAGKPQGARELLKANLGGDRPLGITSSGTLYFWDEHSFRQLMRIVSLDLENGRAPSTVNELLPPLHQIFGMSMWSPDGKYLMYVATDDNFTAASVVIRSADGRQTVREFPLQLHYGAALRWTPDGQSFLSVGADDQKRGGLYRVDATTGNLTLLVPGEGLNWPNSSPDGKRLYFTRTSEDEKETVVVRRDLASGDERELIRGDSMGPPFFSPDGRYVAVRGVDPATKAHLIRVVSTAGGPVRDLRLPSTGAEKVTNVLGAIWVPDSQSFLTRKRIEGQPLDEVWRVPVNGDPPRKTEITLGRNVPIYLNMSPDGRLLAYGVANGFGNDWEVWALENFLPPVAGK